MSNPGEIDLLPALSWVATVAGPVSTTRRLPGGWTSTMLALRIADAKELVLRVMTREPWRTHGAELTTRESQIQQMLAETGIPAPESVALDAEGATCGYPTHLMTLVPGRTQTEEVGVRSLDRLAQVLVDIHDVQPSIEVREYQSWAFEAKRVVPDWTADADLWKAAFAVLSDDTPQHERTFIHRDFQLRNVLWSRDEVSGVVDWVETSVGPAWLDVAHCCTNIALNHGDGPADGFANAYVARTGRQPQPYFDVMDIVGFLAPPDREGLIKDPSHQLRLEHRLRTVLDRMSWG